MDAKDNAKKGEAGTGSNIEEKDRNPPENISDEELHDEDLEDATDKLSNKSKRLWREYEKSLAPPKQDTSSESPLRKSLEDLRLQRQAGESSPGPSNKMQVTETPNANRGNHSRIEKPKKRSKWPKNLTNLKGENAKGANTEEVGRIVDPIGSVDLPLDTSEQETSNTCHREPDRSITKYFACTYCDERFQYCEEWASTLQEHKIAVHQVPKS